MSFRVAGTPILGSDGGPPGQETFGCFGPRRCRGRPAGSSPPNISWQGSPENFPEMNAQAQITGYVYSEALDTHLQLLGTLSRKILETWSIQCKWIEKGASMDQKVVMCSGKPLFWVINSFQTSTLRTQVR